MTFKALKAFPQRNGTTVVAFELDGVNPGVHPGSTVRLILNDADAARFVQDQKYVLTLTLEAPKLAPMIPKPAPVVPIIPNAFDIARELVAQKE